MKTSKLLLASLVALAGLTTACSNEDDLPMVNLTVDYSGAVYADGKLYVVAGDELSIDALTVTPIEGTKRATLGATAYYWNYQYLGTTIVEPFGLSISTVDMSPGDYLLQINSTVYQVDKSVGIAYITYPVVVVADASELPETDNAENAGRLTPDTDIRSGAMPTD